MIFSLLKKLVRCFRTEKKQDIREQYPQYQIGRCTYGNPQILTWGEDSNLEIGAFCSIGRGVMIFLGGEHRTDWVTTYPFNILWESARNIKGHPKTKGDVIIGNDVWIGYNAVILSGVSIGDGSVIGTDAVVTTDIPPYAIAAGNPARVLKKRFDEETIVRLINLKWWDWEDERIEKMLPFLLNTDIQAFLNKAEKEL